MDKYYWCPACASVFVCKDDTLTTAYCKTCGNEIKLSDAKAQNFHKALLNQDKNLLIRYALEGEKDMRRGLLSKLSEQNSPDALMALGVYSFEKKEYDNALFYFSKLVNTGKDEPVSSYHVKAAALLAATQYLKDPSTESKKRVVELLDNVFRLYYQVREQSKTPLFENSTLSTSHYYKLSMDDDMGFVGICRQVQENLAEDLKLTNYTKY